MMLFPFRFRENFPTIGLMLLFPIILGATACKERIVDSHTLSETGQEKESLINAQRISVRQEMESIESFVKRSGWNMQESPTGIWYEIYQPTQGTALIAPGDAVIFSYTLHLLNGNLIEQASEENPKTVILGKSEIPEGLRQALLRMKKGESARFIIPSHLAYGFSGNGENIPAQASLLYNIHVLEVKIPPESIF